MVHTAASISLVQLEMFVHLDSSDLLLSYSVIRLEIDPAGIPLLANSAVRFML
jgi:hypothetical protein